MYTQHNLDMKIGVIISYSKHSWGNKKTSIDYAGSCFRWTAIISIAVGGENDSICVKGDMATDWVGVTEDD